MNITFKEVNKGIVAARGKIQIDEGVYLQEVTILRKNNEITVEFPQKSFRGKTGKMFYLDILKFDGEEKETLWKLKIKNEYFEWSKKNKKIDVYDSE